MKLDHLKYRYLAFTQVVFSVSQEVANEFKLPIQQLTNHLSI